MNRVIKGLMLIVALVIATLIGTEIGSSQSKQIKVTEGSKLTAQYNLLQKRYSQLNTKYQKMISTGEDQTDVSKATKFFEEVFNYDNNTSRSHFNKALSFGSRQAVSVFQVDGDALQQAMGALSSRLAGVQYYREIGSDDILAIVTNDFTYRNQATKQTLIYDVTLDQSGKIQKLIVRNLND